MALGDREELSMRIAGEIVLSSDHGRTMKKWREIFGATQKDISERLGVSASVISDYESGRRSSPGADLVSRITAALMDFDEANGSRVLKAYSHTLAGREMETSIMDMREFPVPVSVEFLCSHIEGEILVEDAREKDIYGYTAIDGPRAILELSSQEFFRIYGLTPERALVFMRVSQGRSPFVAIRVSPIKPGVVIIQGPKKVDALGIKIAQMEKIPVILSSIEDPAELKRRLRGIQGG
ncbi:MAG: helix-turn-helix domain-containing protein [Euryarchaeota archaeon]|nr:helix-turn-helix domain-containing protein [Euryarchaeota archaeon]